MPLRIGFLGVRHMHSYGYAGPLKSNKDVSLVGVYDADHEASNRFAQAFEIRSFDRQEALVELVDAVVICSENMIHAELGIRAANDGKHLLIEKPLVTRFEDGKRLIAAAQRNNVVLMTAFPCRFSPAFRRLKERVQGGDIGQVVGCCTTNRGSCPFDWFVDPELSGGGAMIDHTVHVSDLLRDLLQDEPVSVMAQIGNNIYGQEWEDTAMLSLDFAKGTFATLDSSWSRPKSYKTWGDVTMTVVGEKGVLELDMFGPGIDVYSNSSMRHGLSSYGSNLDALLAQEFVDACLEQRSPLVTGLDGLRAAQVAFAGYESAQTHQPVALAA